MKSNTTANGIGLITIEFKELLHVRPLDATIRHWQ